MEGTRREHSVFVVSAMRSGSTLLRYLLDTHEHLACPPETKFISALERAFEYPQVAKALCSLGYSRADIYRKLGQLAEDILRGYAARHRKPRWIDKTPGYYRSVPFIDAIFEGRVLYIVLIRQPLDSIASLEQYCSHPTEYDEDPDLARMVRLHGKGRYGWAKYWTDVYERAQWLVKTHPERTHVVRYEDLVRGPQENLSQLLEFLGESAELLDVKRAFSMKHTAGYQDSHILKATRIRTDRMDQWKNWEAEEIRALWDLVGPVAEWFNYWRPDECRCTTAVSQRFVKTTIDAVDGPRHP